MVDSEGRRRRCDVGVLSRDIDCLGHHQRWGRWWNWWWIRWLSLSCPISGRRWGRWWVHRFARSEHLRHGSRRCERWWWRRRQSIDDGKWRGGRRRNSVRCYCGARRLFTKWRRCWWSRWRRRQFSWTRWRANVDLGDGRRRWRQRRLPSEYTPQGFEPSLNPTKVSPSFQPNGTIRTR